MLGFSARKELLVTRNHYFPAVIQAMHLSIEKKLFRISLMFELSCRSGQHWKEQGFAWKGTTCQMNFMDVIRGNLEGLHGPKGKINLLYSQ